MPSPFRHRAAPVLGALLLSVASHACLGGSTSRPVGGACSGDRECAAPLVCAYGRCRSPCTYDRDCPSGTRCVTGPSGAGVCALVEEPGCEDVGCPEGQACVGSECVAVFVPTADGDADADVDAAADGDVDAEAGGPCLCDLDQDGVCTGEEAALCIEEFGRVDCHEPATPCLCDLDDDGDCDMTDQTTFMRQHDRPECQ